MQKAMKIDVCIATVRPDSLCAAVGSIQRQVFTDWTLTIVGQGADPQLFEMGQRFTADPRIRYLPLARKGLSLARNSAIETMTSDVIAFTDDDCEADENWLAELSCLFRDVDIGMAAGPLIAPPPRQPGIGFVPNVQTPDVDCVAGANIALRASAIAKVGKFDETLGAGARFPSGEDTDYLSRIADAKIKFVFHPQAVVRHTHGWRYGWRAVFNIKRAYALGYGAFVAKRRMAGIDLTNFERKVIRNSIRTAIFARDPKAFVFSSLRAYYCWQGYRECMKYYGYNAKEGVLFAL